MKKIIVAFLMMLTASIGFAQKSTITQEQVRSALAQGMANFVTSVKPFYKSQGQAQFIKAVCGVSIPTKEGAALLNKSYDYIAKGLAKDEIIKSYPGGEMAASVLFLKKVYDINPKSDGSELFGGKTGSDPNPLAKSAVEPACKWYQIWCHLQNFFNWIIANWPTIRDILLFLIPLL